MAEGKIANLINNNECHLKSKNDQLEMTEHLKATIKALHRNSSEKD